jgi:N-hydroxyarylamine O-acetyltransferase
MRLHDYLRRIGVAVSPGVTADTLQRLHAGHAGTFLFENLSIQTGGTISVAEEDVERKFVDQQQGGYCFEHNTLFAAALRAQGFQPDRLLGRVRRGPPERWARTHMVLRVPIGQDVWLADVGFGAIGLVDPIPLRDGATAAQRGLRYSLRKDGHLWILSAQDAKAVTDLYEFSEDPQTAGDVVVANHYTSTHPDSIFRRTLTIQRIAGDERRILRNETLTRHRDGRATEETVPRDRLRRVAQELFDVELPDGPFVYESYAAIA